ncbi:uncharacterized protein L969DRAFT_102623 [Mixia osmundae IAM 14324]|uniref:Major facilitator superfamily (MFS) profile domain-containing protein n=1 Tax=Mixia osmundae (strain CBS 9802 / IAM 14324 / JCM 22182 / KY 12970) TaxID=764103 RepID=G7E9D1_MIXOS|nr:uncharacterized protein L969DRAFT_102623 [Mixia osmundae IAM 14324]KEI39880.1 hypothetical protein L969DRAFT_102623 [Mixia osmundae IAM 14324]GAA99250.1 hypothetical protein E5Q_05944 [Mixia osmundae IAM 14324]
MTSRQALLDEHQLAWQDVPSSSPRTAQPDHLEPSWEPRKLSSIDYGTRSHDEPSSPLQEESASLHSETPLDRTLERVGFGLYQKRLLLLAGGGWAAENAWLQGIAVILPRVQAEYAVSDRYIGLLSASMFAGMAVGASFWGSISDSYGRLYAFQGTLLVTAIFGTLAFFTTSFLQLCLVLVCLGTGVGGSISTDGTLALECIPKTKHFLITGLSFFFSLGAVTTSLLALIILPSRSCVSNLQESDVADLCTNNGWKLLLLALGGVTFVMFLCRVLFFRLHESAKFLVVSGRTEEAVLVLREILRVNGKVIDLSVEDMQDDVDMHDSAPIPQTVYDHVPESANPDEQINGHERKHTPSIDRSFWSRYVENIFSSYEQLRGRINILFSPKWARTTTLVWLIWFFVSAGYTIFNVYLPKFLEDKVGREELGGGLTESLQEYVIYTVAGCPGSIIGAYLIETRLGRRGSMALSTLMTALGTFIFVMVTSKAGVVLSSMLVSLMATLMYAIIYGYTPEVFEARIRGTGCGIASALSRVAGIIAPLLTGLLLSLSVSLPLFVSAGAFATATICMATLPFETRGR